MRDYEWAAQRVLIDGLTGLYNHSHFFEELNREVQRGRRYEHPAVLLLVDVDHFREYNERHGYLAGDSALVALAKLLRSLLRQVDIAGRYGGEEFGILLPETGLSGGLQVAERIRIGVQAYPLPHRELQPGGAFTVSVGAAALAPAIKTGQDLVDAALTALRDAKAQGGNRVASAGEPQ